MYKRQHQGRAGSCVDGRRAGTADRLGLRVRGGAEGRAEMPGMSEGIQRDCRRIGRAIMEFTYKAYTKLIDLLKKHNYSFTDYSDFERQDKSVILRHDVDYDLHRVLKMAERCV